MFSIFKRKKSKPNELPLPIAVDIHSHLIPGIDDGAATLEESVAMLSRFADMGYKKLVTTPHIMGDFYKNTPETILGGLEKIKTAALKNNIELDLAAAAEYYLDEFFFENLGKEKSMLTFGDNYLLFETSYMNKPNFLEESIFMMHSQGFKPILAHPERYVFFFGKAYKDLVELKEKGVLFQININSLSGYYSKMSKEITEKLIEDELVDFIGSDCHKMKHLEVLEETRKHPLYAKVTRQKILNDTLLATI